MVIQIIFPRIYIREDRDDPLHRYLKDECLWGGADHRIEQEGIVWLGYELSQMQGYLYSKTGKPLSQVIQDLEIFSVHT